MRQTQSIPLFLNVTRLHFNLSDQRARRWLLDAAFVPRALREVLQEHDENRRVEWTDGGLLRVISDFTYEDESDPRKSHRCGAMPAAIC
jgi:zinc transporter